MHKNLLIFILLFFSLNVFSYEDPKKYKDIDPSFIKIIIKDPDQKVGYTVGDKISREIIFTVKKPYQLVEESLPIEGYEKRYRGQKLGVVLQNIKYLKKDEGEEVRYKINLTYQIFTNNVVAKPASVTADYYRLINLADSENILKSICKNHFSGRILFRIVSRNSSWTTGFISNSDPVESRLQNA